MNKIEINIRSSGDGFFYQLIIDGEYKCGQKWYTSEVDCLHAAERAAKRLEKKLNKSN